jgi:hypothetical protein
MYLYSHGLSVRHCAHCKRLLELNLAVMIDVLFCATRHQEQGEASQGVPMAQVSHGRYCALKPRSQVTVQAYAPETELPIARFLQSKYGAGTWS